MKRILRKDTALYQELEQTLRRYYDVRRELEAREKGYKAYEFCDLYSVGCIIQDAKETWNLRVNAGGGVAKIITLDWFTKMGGALSPLETRLCGEGMVLPVVYNKYRKMTLPVEPAQLKQEWFQEKAGDQEQFRSEVVSALKYLRKEYEIYFDRFGSQNDPAAEIAKTFGLTGSDAKEIEELILFYNSLLEALQTNIKLMGIADEEFTGGAASAGKIPAADVPEAAARRKWYPDVFRSERRTGWPQNWFGYRQHRMHLPW